MLSRVGEVAYKLQLRVSSFLHLVFHVSQLRHAHGVAHSSSLLLPQLSMDLELIVEPTKVLEVCCGQPNGRGDVEVLIKWKDLLALVWGKMRELWFHPTAVSSFQGLHFHLEDKVKIWAVGNDRPPMHYTYAGRYHSKWLDCVQAFMESLCDLVT